MATLRTIDAQTLSNLNKALIGFDLITGSRLASTHANNYPPYNIIKYDDTHYAIEIAIAGFSKDEVSIKIDQNQLTVSGEHAMIPENEEIEYLHRGLASRNFEHTFALTEYLTVDEAEVKDGLLKITFLRIIPEWCKPHNITIK
jgi:HSP20 family molecular chaperone IbpA